jgi:hypothetical protein
VRKVKYIYLHNGIIVVNIYIYNDYAIMNREKCIIIILFNSINNNNNNTKKKKKKGKKRSDNRLFETLRSLR